MTKECIDCKEVLPLTAFNRNGGNAKYRPECSVCEKRRRIERQTTDPFKYTVNKLADGILSRTGSKIDHPKNKIYKERGIKCLLGASRNEVVDTLIDNFSEDIKRIMDSGEKPSVDRIDPYGHYEVGNIQIITLQENLLRSNITSRARSVEVTLPQGEVMVFESVAEASRELGIKRDTIYWGADNPGGNRKGYEFKID